MCVRNSFERKIYRFLNIDGLLYGYSAGGSANTSDIKGVVQGDTGCGAAERSENERHLGIKGGIVA